MHDWEWSDNRLLLLTAQYHTSKVVGQWTWLHQRPPGSLAVWRCGKVHRAHRGRISRVLLLVFPGLSSSPISRAHSLLGCHLLWLMTIISQDFYTPELYTKKKWRERAGKEPFTVLPTALIVSPFFSGSFFFTCLMSGKSVNAEQQERLGDQAFFPLKKEK